ncbi:hypothetical protein GCM10011519_31020 [Marmoricola endophyticus]|uniref:N-acetyltransferase domain-containing protein n=1 Tax=Marmoricola endophyticus TaxID=2040280 RepID=A0A917BQD7_9ACTN|nr:GNAT family N-acetyltransferase [Marmoricola endophyticus]GGF54872.1 hypothetical protein GCM10011519_31020 [Marmoricola endophyticus]
MDSDARPEGRTGQHGLGPHVVGQRVVVRRLLRGGSGEVEVGPTGGPAMTDVLGVCEVFEPGGEAVVRREDGEVVRIPTADIVSGKPVPPRPSPRLSVDARTAEAHGRVLWPHVERVPLGEWELRTEARPIGRPRKRANSCLAMGDPGMAAEEAVEAVRAFYAGRERPAIAQVEADSAQEAAFAAAGWAPVPGGDAAYLLAPVSRTLRLLRGYGTRAEVTGDVRVTAEVRLATQVVATGQAGLDGDWAGVHGLHVLPTRRRQGLALEVMAGLLERAAEQGATTAWLHVETDNAPAIALYERLGFTEHHRLRYLQA